MALALGELCEGELAGLFSGHTSEGISLDGPVVVLDLGSLYTSAGLAVAMVCAGAWLRSTVAAQDGRQRLLIVDEAWRLFYLPDAAELLQASAKTSRRGVANVFVVHRLSDLAAAGDAGTRTRAIVEGLLADCETRVVFGAADDQVASTATLLRLSETEAAWLTKLSRGRPSGGGVPVVRGRAPVSWDARTADRRYRQWDEESGMTVDVAALAGFGLPMATGVGYVAWRTRDLARSGVGGWAGHLRGHKPVRDAQLRRGQHPQTNRPPASPPLLSAVS